MTKPKILVLVSPQGDAMHRDAFEGAAALTDAYEVFALVPNDQRAAYRAAGIACAAWRPSGYFGMTTAYRIITSAVKRFGPDLVQAHGFPAIGLALGTFPASLASRTVATFHDPQRDKEMPQKLVDLRFPKYLARAAAVVATYPALARALEGKFDRPAGSIGVIPHGVDEPLGNAALARPVARPGPVVGWTGWLSADRAWETAIDGFALVREHLPDARMIVAGGGRARQLVKAHAREVKVDEAVALPGEIRSDRLFAEIDMLVVPISRSAQVQGTLEALVAGIPVIASNAGALADAVGAVETGWLVDDRAADFATAIELVWNGIDAAWDGAGKQRSEAIARYGRDEVSARYRELYASVLAAREA